LARQTHLPEIELGGTPCSRASSAVITDAQRFEAVWSDVSPRLRRFLATRCVNPADIDDVVQETAERVLARRVAYTSADNLFSWCCTVAWRLAITLHRRRARMAGPPEADVVASDDVAATVELRDELATVASVFPLLSVLDRAAITSTVEPSDRREAVKLAVRRHRARMRLMALVDAAVAIVVGLARRVLPNARRSVAVSAATALPILVIAALAFPSSGATRRDNGGLFDVRADVLGRMPTGAAAPRLASAAVTDAPARPHPSMAGVPTQPRAVATDIPDPTGHRDGHVTVRPRDETDHFICSDALTGSMVCVDPPTGLPLLR